MARISSLTVFIFTTLIIYTIIGGLFSAWASTGSTSGYTTPYSSTLPISVGSYTYSETHNITDGAALTTYTAFTPDKYLSWGIFPYSGFVTTKEGNLFGFIPWHFPADWYYDSNDTKIGTELSEATVNNTFTTTLNASKFRIDIGTAYYADAYFMPCYNSTGFVYDCDNASRLMLNSLGNGTVTVFIGSNSTDFSYFDLSVFTSAVSNVLTGFYGIGAPMEVSIILAGVWWILLALGIAKLILG